MPVVIDTSVALKWVRKTETHTSQAEALRDDLLHQRDLIFAPTLLISEVTSGLYRFARAGDLTFAEAADGLDDILAVIRLRAVTRTLAKRAMQIANLTGERHAYDAQFLALAERMQCDLWTADEDFRRAMNRNGFMQVRAIGTYFLPTP
jgi:predicted nucleic acid-binding protein